MSPDKIIAEIKQLPIEQIMSAEDDVFCEELEF